MNQADTLRMIEDCLLVREDPGQDDRQVGKIFIPEYTGKGRRQKEGARFGTVLECGPGITTRKGAFIPVGIKPGEHIMYGQYAGSNILSPTGEKLLVINESVVWGLTEN